VAAPMPLAPPVTRAVLPSKRKASEDIVATFNIVSRGNDFLDEEGGLTAAGPG
jgi:hypothetical protein